VALVEEVAADVFFARGEDANWILLRDGKDVTLIDTGYPGYRDQLLRSLAEVGSAPQRVAAVLITHAHIDHIGNADHLARTHGTPICTDAREVRHAHREYVEQASPLDVAKHVVRPGTLGWLARVVRLGVLSRAGAPTARPFPTEGELDLPGRPRPVPTRGHTSGHVAYYLPAARAVATGDELVTGHALLPGTGPALLPAFFNHGDSAPALARLDDLDADLLLPGHGPALRMPLRDAIDQALAGRR
jgi:glyoxylase-like metal-dependent hydrolase (beta-lactamase superfamily II)